MTTLHDRLAEAEPVRAVRRALAGYPDEAWIVGGTVRDALLGRAIVDVDVVVAGDPRAAARAVAREVSGPLFSLSDAYGTWRAMDRARAWVCDVSPLAPDGLFEDLARRDLTINAMAVPLPEGELVDPHGGRDDLRRGLLRVVGPGALAADPLRPLRLARIGAELGFRPDADTARLTAAAASRVSAAAPERVFAELRRLVVSDRVLEGLALADELGLVAAVLPELHGLRDVEQSHFHHLDVHGHTLEVLTRLIELEDDLPAVFGDHAAPLRKVLAEPLADEMTRGQALRFGALLHDVAKPATRGVLPTGRVTFIGHDRAGEEMVAALCRRLRTSERLRDYLAKLTLHHLALGFLVPERPLSRRAVYRYLTTCEPVEVEVTLLSCADRLATRGRNAETAIAAHLDLARELMGEALEWRAGGPPRVPVRGDELALELGIDPGPEIGALLASLREASFAGEVSTRSEAVELAHRLRQTENGDR